MMLLMKEKLFRFKTNRSPITCDNTKHLRERLDRHLNYVLTSNIKCNTSLCGMNGVQSLREILLLISKLILLLKMAFYMD